MLKKNSSRRLLEIISEKHLGFQPKVSARYALSFSRGTDHNETIVFCVCSLALANPLQLSTNLRCNSVLYLLISKRSKMAIAVMILCTFFMILCLPWLCLMLIGRSTDHMPIQEVNEHMAGKLKVKTG